MHVRGLLIASCSTPLPCSGGCPKCWQLITTLGFAKPCACCHLNQPQSPSTPQAVFAQLGPSTFSGSGELNWTETLVEPTAAPPGGPQGVVEESTPGLHRICVLDSTRKRMPKNEKRRARLAAQERTELETLRAQESAGSLGDAPVTQSTGSVPRCDWNCGACAYLNYGGNLSCWRCAATRQQDTNVHGRYRGRPLASDWHTPSHNARHISPPSFLIQSHCTQPI